MTLPICGPIYRCNVGVAWPPSHFGCDGLLRAIVTTSFLTCVGWFILARDKRPPHRFYGLSPSHKLKKEYHLIKDFSKV
ncbi:MAG: hypothetical protein V1769_01055 [Thermoplasmatota archaeon]